MVSITPVQAKINAYTGRDHCLTSRNHWPSSPKQAEITRAEIAKGRAHREASRPPIRSSARPLR